MRELENGVSGENSSLSCRISETGRTRVLNKWNLWDEFEGFISGRSFGNGCGKELDNQGSIIFNINFNIILTYRGG